MTPEPSKVTNAHGVDEPWCIACGNTGYVHLAGGTGRTGVPGRPKPRREEPRYSTGGAPCKWCTLGRRRYLHALDTSGWKQPLTDFEWDAVMPVGERNPHISEETRKKNANRFRILGAAVAGRKL
jgi:hypothetical protein